MKQYIVEFESDFNRGFCYYIKFKTDNPPLDYYRANIMRGDHYAVKIFEIKEII